tara:strand:+ start:1008 stop:1250 length:243 start_codon:yes stop_codon:yes gene_type:complete
MEVSAEVTIENGTFDEWVEFFNSYKEERKSFVVNETIKKISDKSALVSFEILDLEGLTKLSSRSDIVEMEQKLKVTTSIK